MHDNLTKIEQILKNCKQYARVIYSSGLSTDPLVMSKLHPVFYEHYLPIKTNGDGNCLYNMVSICLFGNSEKSAFLRYITVCVLMKYQDDP